MTELEIIQKIQLLKQVQPRKEWVVLTKREILGPRVTREYKASLLAVVGKWFAVPFAKPVFVTAFSVFIVFGAFGLSFVLSQNSLPGDLLYPMKQLTEKSQALFVSDDEKSNFHLDFANEKVEELAKIQTKSDIKRDDLIVALKSLNDDISAASKQLKNAAPSRKDILASKTDKLIKKTQAVLTDMQNSGNEEVTNALAKIAEREIRDLENRSLTEDQTEFLAEAKKEFEAGNFSQALEKIWQISNR